MDYDFEHMNVMYLPVVDVYDGDTIFVKFTLPAPLDDMKVRIRGIDTPEVPAKSYYETGKLGRAQCVHEAELALAARDHLRELIREFDNVIIVTNFDWDKYGGRIDADAFVGTDDVWINVQEDMINNGYAVPYFGGKKTKDWCDETV